jgi:hypothetical protein
VWAGGTRWLNGVSSQSPPTAAAASTLRDSSSLASDLTGLAAPGSLPSVDRAKVAARETRWGFARVGGRDEVQPTQTCGETGRVAASSPFGGSHVAPPDSGVGLTTVGSPLRSELQHKVAARETRWGFARVGGRDEVQPTQTCGETGRERSAGSSSIFTVRRVARRSSRQWSWLDDRRFAAAVRAER